MCCAFRDLITIVLSWLIKVLEHIQTYARMRLCSRYLVFRTVVVNDDNLSLVTGDGDGGVAGCETECVPLRGL